MEDPENIENKGLKRLANSPISEPVDEPKKPKLDSAVDVITIDDTNVTPAKTPKTPKMSKEERERLKQQKQEERERTKQEKERALEEKRQEKERIAEEKRLEKEKKERERLEKKQEEERKKEEKKREVEEKKRKDEEEKELKKREENEKKEAKRKEEEAIEEKKKRDSARFMGFFNKVEKKKLPEIEVAPGSWYLPFQIKQNVSVAPILMRDPLPADAKVMEQDPEVTIKTYLNSDAVKKRKLVTSRKVELRSKLFQFHDNRRPPYYGTFRTGPKVISGRRPFYNEPGLDYAVQSDDEWEDEPSDGEECRSDEEDEGDDDALSDDGFFVPPCYLSDGEGEEEDDGDTDVQTVGGNKPEQRRRSGGAGRVIIESDDEEPGRDAESGEERKNSQNAASIKRVRRRRPDSDRRRPSTSAASPPRHRTHRITKRSSNVERQEGERSEFAFRRGIAVDPTVLHTALLKSLVHECNIQLALFRHATQGIGTSQDGASLRREVETSGRACLRACEAAKAGVLPQLRNDEQGPDFTKNASQFIGCCAAYLVEMKRCVVLEQRFPAPTEPSIAPHEIEAMEAMVESLENLITVHFSTSEPSPTEKVTPRRRRGTSCRPQCVCSKLKTSYA